MITGFNTNVRHGGRVFHVQTEDSGRAHPHVISHLYCGGTILASEKREYADHLEDEDLTGLVRRLMEEQHKSMLTRLSGGEFDPVIAGLLGAEATDGKTDGTGDTAPQPVAAATSSSAGESRAFGESIVSEKPLDEVILEYLVDKSRTRGPRSRE